MFFMQSNDYVSAFRRKIQTYPQNLGCLYVNELIGLCRTMLQRQQSLEENLIRRLKHRKPPLKGHRPATFPPTTSQH